MSRRRPLKPYRSPVPTFAHNGVGAALGRHVNQNDPQIRALRAEERRHDEHATRQQRRENLLACLYGRHITVNINLQWGEWKCLGPHPDNPESIMWRRGRKDMLPSAQNLRNSQFIAVEVAPDVADRLIARDGGDL